MTRPTYADQPVPTAEYHDDGTVTFAVTMRWNPEWADGTCEVAHLSGRLRTAILESFRDAETVDALVSVLCWYPSEEVLIGHWQDAPWSDRPANRPINLRTGEFEYTERDLELQDAWRTLTADVRRTEYKAHDTHDMVELGKRIRESLAVIHPNNPDDSAEWTAMERASSLAAAIARANLTETWTARTLNEAFMRAERKTKKVRT